MGVALACLAIALAVGVAAVGAGALAYAGASAAADAAALAAAPVTFRPFGATGTPGAEAARFAARNGARLVSCRCAVDRSFATRTVQVTVEREVRIPLIGSIRVRASSRATFEPSALIPVDAEAPATPVPTLPRSRTGLARRGAVSAP